MGTVVLHASHGDAEIQIDSIDAQGRFDVSISVNGMRAQARIDASNADMDGWPGPGSILVAEPEQSLLDLLAFVSEHRDGWKGEQCWMSHDLRLQLGFTHRDDGLRLTVTLRDPGSEPWIVSTAIEIGARDVSPMITRLRELAEAVPV